MRRKRPDTDFEEKAHRGQGVGACRVTSLEQAAGPAKSWSCSSSPKADGAEFPAPSFWEVSLCSVPAFDWSEEAHLCDGGLCHFSKPTDVNINLSENAFMNRLLWPCTKN